MQLETPNPHPVLHQQRLSRCKLIRNTAHSFAVYHESSNYKVEEGSERAPLSMAVNNDAVQPTAVFRSNFTNATGPHVPLIVSTN